MSSMDDKTDSGSQNKLDIEAFRHHLLNYRSKVDESESDLTYQFELDSSFKRILDEKRQMTNKENNPPAVEQASTSINPPEKPLRMDLLKERLRNRMQDDSLTDQSSYVMDYSIGTDLEFSTINRLLADFNLNRDSSTTQKRSPLKMLKITGDSLNDGGSFFQNQHSENGDARASNVNNPRGSAMNDVPEAISSNINADDTLEEIEYVLDRGLNYVPKRLINEIKTDSDMKQEFKSEESQEYDENQENDENAISSSKSVSTASTTKPVAAIDDDDEVIVLDSSPENSFVTTQATERYKSAFESIENTFYTAKSNLNNISILSIDSDSSDDQSINTQTVDQSAQSTSKSGEKPRDILAANSLELSASTHKDISSVSSVSSVNYGEMPNFNDTLERVEYMMEQGQKMLHNKNNQCVPTNVQNKKTPVSQPKLKPKVLTPNSAPAKKFTPKHLTPNKGDWFKRPEQRNLRSPFAAKTTSASKPNSHSRIPTKSGSLHKPQFRHIASPIAAYINNTPEVPLLKTIKPVRNLLAEDFSKVCQPSSLDESTQSVESFPTKSALPRKMYISAPQRKIIDHRYMVTPGGKSVQKLIGQTPLVIRHDGKVKSHNNPAHVAAQQFEESLSDLSMVSGDISVQVVQDVHRYH